MENRRLGACAADQHIALATIFSEYLIAMIGLALEIPRQAGTAITELTGGGNGDAVTAQHADDRLADRDLVFDAAFCEPDAERLILDDGPDRRRREIFAVRGAHRPFLRRFGRR